MNEQAIKYIVEGVVRKVMAEMGTGVCPSGAGVYAGSYACSTGGEGIPVELSARHAHLSQADAIALFGGPLTPVKELSQPGQFLCKERVRLIGPKGVMDNVAVLGPSRGASQVEISKTDARTLGVETPVRLSGDVAETPGIILASQTGIVGLEHGLIVAARHIHMSPKDAARYCVVDKERVHVRVDGDRPVVLEDVLVRVHPDFCLALHIDSDEGNSFGWKNGALGYIVGKAR